MLAYPNPVNENVSRVVAAGVAALTIAALLTGWHLLIAVIALGFLARTVADVRLSLLGRMAVKLAPRLGPPRFVPGPIQRFAQGLGFVLTTVAAFASLVLDRPIVAVSLMAVVLVLALMESVIGICAACELFSVMIRQGWVPDRTREACQQVWLRYGARHSLARQDQVIRFR